MADVLPATARSLLALLARAQSDARAPSLVAAVFRDGDLAWSAGRGAVPGDDPADVQYRLGSITKTITAITVLRLRDEGRLRLDDQLEQHLPGTPHGGRTLAQLLGHLGGVGSESPGEWWERTPGSPLAGLGLTDADVVLPAGRRFHYSNLGFGLLGELVARARGRDWADVVRSEVLLPLGMNRTTTRPSGVAAQGYAVHPWADLLLPEPEHDAGSMAPAGQLWSTARDLSKLGLLLLGDTGGVLSPDTVEEMATPTDGDDADKGWSSYGLGVMVEGEDGVTLVGHGGSMPGFLAGLWVDRSEQIGALSMANTTTGLDGGLAQKLMDVVRAAEPHIEDAWAPRAPAVPLAWLGPWYWGPGPFVLRALGDDLLQLDGLGRSARESRFAPHPQLAGAWIGLDGYYAGETLRFGDPDGDRGPRSFTLATFVFTRAPYDPAAPVPGGVDESGWRLP